MKILVINGPNLNMLGQRDPNHYGSETLAQINKRIENKAQELQVAISFFQSNHEGALIDFIQKESPVADGVIINAGALTHYSYALHDALANTKLPIVEVHLSDISKRESWRQTSVIASIVTKTIMGKKGDGYIEALEFIVNQLRKV